MSVRDRGLGLPPPAAPPGEIAAAAQLACLLEAHAPKPGNVSPGRDFADVGYGDFVASAAAIGAPFARVADVPLGALVREAVDATSRWTPSNTNLGIVLLLAPLAKAALGPNDVRSNLAGVLEATTVEDAREVYAAIRAANPGGLGRAANQDVAREPTLPLREVMRLAADRDGIAREYDTTFAATFDTGVPALRQARADGLGWDDAVVETFLTLLAAAPDTHIAGGPAWTAPRASRAWPSPCSPTAACAPTPAGCRWPASTARSATIATWPTRARRRISPPPPSSCCCSKGAGAAEGIMIGCSAAVSSAFPFPRTTWCSRRRTSSRLPAIVARGCTGTTTGRA